jgi:hypothetical protein
VENAKNIRASCQTLSSIVAIDAHYGRSDARFFFRPSFFCMVSVKGATSVVEETYYHAREVPLRSRLLPPTVLIIGALLLNGCGNLPFIGQSGAQPTAQPTAPSGGSSGAAPTRAPQPTPAAAQPTAAPSGGGTQPAPAPPASGGGGAQPMPMPQTPSGGGTQPAPAPPASGGGENVSVPGSQANLSQLESYRVAITWKLTGKTTDGKNVEEQTTYTQALHRPSNTSYTLVVENKPGAQGTRSEIYSVGDTLYIYEKDRGVCQPAMMAGMGDMLRGITDSMTAPLRTGDAKLVNRGETINGILTDRYTLDEASASQFGAVVEKADLWVAREGGYLVKYDLTIKVMPGSMNPANIPADVATFSEGTIAYNWTLEDINKTTITIPSVCSSQTVGVDLPLPPGTQVDMAMGNITMGKAKASMDSVLAFFKTEYPKLGYQLTYETGDAQSGYILEFAKSGQKVTVQFSTSSDGSVGITLMRE